MLIWFALVIPLITVPVLLFLFPRRIVWWELAIPLAASLVVICVCKYGTETFQTRDVEYWGGWLAHAEYYEDWDETVPCRHPVYRTNSKGQLEFVGYAHAFDVDYHPPYWLAHDSNGVYRHISSEHFERLAQKFGSRVFVDLGRSYHSNDGDKYVAMWDKRDETFTPFTSIHTYENRVQASDSVFNFQEVDPKEYSLFEYPEIQSAYICPSILGRKSLDAAGAEKELSILNAKLGAIKQVRIWILVFVDKPFQAAIAQQNYWKNGNKNELVIVIGVDSRHVVKWCHVFSWTEAETLKISVRSKVAEQEGEALDLVKIIRWLGPEVKERWVRKPFADFSYLTVEPPGWMIGLTYFLVLLVSAGTSWWAICNQFTEDK